MEYGYLDKEVKALVAERDRLLAENAELRATIETISTERNLFLQQRTEAIDKGVYWQDKSKTHERMFRAANATLDALREAVPDGDDNPEEWPYGNGPGCVRRVQSILYPKETDNGES